MNFKKYLITSLSITSGLLIIIIAAIVFLANDASQKSEQIGQIKTEITSKNRALELLSLLESDSQKAKTYLSQLNSALIKKEELITSKRDLVSVAQARGASLNIEFRDEIPPSENEPRKTNILMIINNISGGFSGAIDLLKEIENNKYFLNFSTIDLSSNSGKINGNLSGQIFSL